MPLIRIRDVDRGQTDTFYSGEYSPEYIVRSGDLLVSMDGEFRAKIWTGEAALLNQRVCRIDVNAEVLDKRYLSHWLPKELTRIEDSTPFATVKHLSIETLRALKINLPPLDEQKHIAAILDKADAIFRKRQQALHLADQLRRSLFLHMFGDPANNSNRWGRVAMKDVIRLNDTINYGVVQPGSESCNGVPLIRVGNLIDGEVRGELKRIDPSIESQYKRSRLHGDELLLSCVGSIGNVALCDVKVAGMNIARAVARLPLDSSKVERQFLAEYLRTPFIQGCLKAETRTVSQPTLNILQISQLPVSIPPLFLQRKFAKNASEIMRLKTLTRSSLSEIERLSESLQTRGFSGDL